MPQIAPRRGGRIATKSLIVAGAAEGTVIHEVFRFDHLHDPKDKGFNDATDMIRESGGTGMNSLLKLAAGQKDRGVRSMVLRKRGAVVAQCIYRICRGPKSIFVEA